MPIFCDASATGQRWTKGLFLKSLVDFAKAIDLTAADFRIELQYVRRFTAIAEKING